MFDVAVIGAGRIGRIHAHNAWAEPRLNLRYVVDPVAAAAEALAAALGGRAGTRSEALACDVVSCVTPGFEPVVDVKDLRPGLHLNMLGADGPGKAEASLDAVAACELFCDEWAQASHGGELTGAVEAGVVTRDRVTDLGAVLAGDAPGRPGPDAVTMFDSTGLAIQDLALCHAVLEAGSKAPTIHL